MSSMHALSLLLLLLVVVTTQGIRLEEESAGEFQKKLKVEHQSLPQGAEKPTVVERAVVCKQSGYCSGSKTRKLINNKEGSSVPPAPPTEVEIEPQKAEKYPDLLDLAGMDYSTAKRKTPIHN